MNIINEKPWILHERRLIVLLGFFGVFGYYFALSNGGNILLFWLVTGFLIVFAAIIIRYGFSYVETLSEPIRIDVLLVLQANDVMEKIVTFLPSINCEIEYADRINGVIMVIPVGVPLWARYIRAGNGPNFIHERIRFDINQETKTKTRVIFEHSIREDIPYKIAMERKIMNKIEEFLRQWQVKDLLKN
jgi:hypothetical protein